MEKKQSGVGNKVWFGMRMVLLRGVWYNGEDKYELERVYNMKFDVNKLEWTREPKDCFITSEKVEVITNPHTDLWQRTYYHFRNDNAPVLQMETSDKFFSFTVKTEFESKHRFDQCGID